MRKLVALLQRQLGISYESVVAWLRTVNSLDAIEARLASGSLEAVVDVDAAAKRVAAELTEAYRTAGKTATKWLDSKMPGKLVTFDTNDSAAVRRAAQSEYELITGFTQEQRAKTRAIVTDGLRRGVNPREMARDLRDSIGLTETQEQHVRNYRRALEEGRFHDARSRELHDDRYNPALRTARSNGQPLTSKQVDTFTERYRENYIKHRAEVIARTEALSAANAGHSDAMRQAVDRGDVEQDQLENEWHAAGHGKNRRDLHQAMDGKRVLFGEDFVLGDGTRMSGPGDPRGGAKHLIHCRCTRSTSLALPPPSNALPTPNAPRTPVALPTPKRALQPVGVDTFRAYKADFTANLDERERAGFLMYSSNKYEYINEVLRKERPHGKWSETIEAMDQGFAKFRAPEDMKVLRGAGSGKRFKDLKPGDVYSDKAYLSTSIDPKVARASLANQAGTEGAMWEIEVPKGAYLAPIPTLYEKELEFVLPRASKLRVLEIEKVEGITYYRAILEP